MDIDEQVREKNCLSLPHREVGEFWQSPFGKVPAHSIWRRIGHWACGGVEWSGGDCGEVKCQC
ncbi:hypothetical protein [Calothrix sp. NIES-2100]|uniref:hypothetical protein n=1 Tax=Calothrix sp. NIES-2100 TaxID=1954172 RepID=UPI0030D9D256